MSWEPLVGDKMVLLSATSVDRSTQVFLKKLVPTRLHAAARLQHVT